MYNDDNSEGAHLGYFWSRFFAPECGNSPDWLKESEGVGGERCTTAGRADVDGTGCVVQ